MLIKKNCKLLLLILLSSASLLEAWRGRAVPIAFNQATNQWSVLLGHDKNGLWSDFSLVAQPGQRGDAVASQALSTQTNATYKHSVSGSPWVKTAKGDIVHFVPVTYISGKDLYLSAQNSIKDDFVWIPASEFAAPGRVFRPHHKHPVNVSYGIKNMLAHYLPDVIQTLNAKNSSSSSSSSSSRSWFGIPRAIYFYAQQSPYYEFTNFVDGYPILLDNKIWSTTEQYYQAQKFTDVALQEKIRNFASDASNCAARKAFNEARDPKNNIYKRSNWQIISLETMIKALRAKFNQHAALKSMLLSTGSAVLVENAGKNDDFFGAGATGQGKNHLGKMLMHIRNELSTNIIQPYAG